MGAVAAWVIVLAIVGAIIFAVYVDVHNGGPQRRAGIKQAKDAMIVCPYCNVKGAVITSTTRQKRGISGGKATAAVLTGGLSTAATGLSRKQTYTQLNCRNCGMGWLVG